MWVSIVIDGIKLRTKNKKSNKIKHLENSGGPSELLIELLCRPHFVLDTLEFAHTSLFHDQFVLHQKYVVEGLSIRQIAKEFLSSKEAVRMGLMNAGILMRERYRPHGRQSQIKFGQRRVNSKVVDYNKEQKIIASAKQMFEQGLSLRQIAKNLSAMGVPTKCKGKKWHPEMVRRMLGSDKPLQ